MKATAILVPLVAAVLVSSCKKEDVKDVPRLVENPTVSDKTATVNKTLLLQLVNEVRQRGCQCGDTYYSPTTPVAWNSQLEQAAYNHSSDMSQNNYFSHTGQDGSDPGVRINRAGYHWTAYGENIAMGYTTEKEAVDAWIKSPGHCQNMMSGAFKDMGVAHVGRYWTQVFAAK